MKKRTGTLLLGAVCAIIYVPAAIVRAAYWLGLSWWLDPVLQRKADRELWEDIECFMPFLVSHCERDTEQRLRVLPSDYAVSCLNTPCIRFTVCRGRYDLTMSFEPRKFPKEEYELSPALSVLQDRVPTSLPRGLFDFDSLLESNWNAINEAICGETYQEFRGKYAERFGQRGTATRELAWEVRKLRR